jgi:hypothetical protein
MLGQYCCGLNYVALANSRHIDHDRPVTTGPVIVLNSIGRLLTVC